MTVTMDTPVGDARTREDTSLMSTDKVYEWGKAGRLRAARDYLGLSAAEMAEQLGMSRNSYQRMESGSAAIPATLWDTVDTVHAEFDAQVRELVTAAEGNTLGLVTLPENAPKWQRAVVARAAYRVGYGALDVRVPDDEDAREEMSQP